jgi:hypothetical protein
MTILGGTSIHPQRTIVRVLYIPVIRSPYLANRDTYVTLTCAINLRCETALYYAAIYCWKLKSFRYFGNIALPSFVNYWLVCYTLRRWSLCSFLKPPLISSSLVHIFSSETCFLTISNYALSLLLESAFHTCSQQTKIYNFLYLIFTFLVGTWKTKDLQPKFFQNYTHPDGLVNLVLLMQNLHLRISNSIVWLNMCVMFFVTCRTLFKPKSSLIG